MQDTEEWDDLREMESQAVGTLNHVLEERFATCSEGSKSFVDVIDDSPQKGRSKFVELGSSDEEDTRGNSVFSGQHTRNSMVTILSYFRIIYFHRLDFLV